jgi:exodeoxyribonuclease VII small subunit
MTNTEQSFEALYGELADVVSQLEEGDDLTLAESLTLFERGAALAEQCNALLDQAEVRVRQLAARADGGLTAETIEILP